MPFEVLKDLFFRLNKLQRFNRAEKLKRKKKNRSCKRKAAGCSKASGQLARVQMASYNMPKTIAVSYLCQHKYTNTHARVRALPQSPAHTCLIHFCLIRLSKPIFSCPSLLVLLAFPFVGFKPNPPPLLSPTPAASFIPSLSLSLSLSHASVHLFLSISQT